MYISLLFAILIVSHTAFVSLRDQKLNKRLSQGIMKSTLVKVLNAPINLFFDVTPVGKIINIF